jgi:hypothetical protein
MTAAAPDSSRPNSRVLPPTDDDGPDAADWEEWDGSSPFWIHCVAGSLAGVVEHTAVYPLDTVRTHIQVCASCIHQQQAAAPLQAKALRPQHLEAASSAASSMLRGGAALRTAAAGKMSPQQLPMGMWQTMHFLMNEPAAAASGLSAVAATEAPVQGISRLWRGVQVILVGCIPAHALYFSSYETVKAATMDPRTGQATAWGSSLAGAAAVVSHDLVMTPLDTVKQRMQLGHYADGVSQAFGSILRAEGLAAFYRSFPITLLSNIPYGMIMVGTHEWCKQAWASPEVPAWQTVLAASSVAGFTAAAVTTPLDRIKTSLQTQALQPACLRTATKLRENCPLRQQQPVVLRYSTFWQAAAHIAKDEGLAGFWRGLAPRVLSHTPAVAISWTTYELAKQTLLQHYSF